MSLGLQIAIRRVAGDGANVTYSYGTRGNTDGLVQIRRDTGEVVLTRASSDDEDGSLFSRVAHKLRKHWQAGDLPERTLWAS